jgi:uncharacterized protein YrzB (UPF0473 family)
MSNIDNIITLTDEEGNDIRFEFLDLINYKQKEYVVLLPCDEPEDGAEVTILIVEDIDSDSESYISVENEDDLNAVFAIFKDKFKDEFNFVD